jgi:tetratricopeptide (TPR) repeat protein
VSRKQSRAVLVIAAIVITVAAATGVPRRAGDAILRWRLRIAVERLSESLATSRRPLARFSALRVTGTRAAAMRGGSTSDPHLEASAARVIVLGSQVPAPEGISATAAAFAVNGKLAKAVTLLKESTERIGNDPRLWSDLAAAELEANRVLRALVASDHALRLDPNHADALFNKGLALERMGLPAAAAVAWRKCLDVAAEAELTAVVRERLRVVESSKSERERWAVAETELLATPPDPKAIERITNEFPYLVRASCETFYLADPGKHDLVRLAGEVLRRRGDTMVAESIAAVDRARAAQDTVRVASLIAAHEAYRRGRTAYSVRDYAKAENELSRAEDAFAAHGSPMRHLARRYLASILVEKSDVDRAAEILTALRSEALDGYRAHIADIGYLLGTCDLLRGRWDPAMAEAERSAELFRQGGEPGNVAMCDALMAAVLDAAGQHDRGWEKRLASFRRISATSPPNRLAITVASGTRAATRAHDRDLALSLLDLELELAAGVRDPSLSADIHTRRVLAQYDENAIARGRIAIATVKDERERARLTIEMDSAEAIGVREKDPRRAIDLLNHAVSFYNETGRRLHLPEVLLQRGRAEVLAGDDAAAARDFADGIAEMEARREKTMTTELRARMFDVAENLFDQAIALEARRGNAEAAFAFAERARGRALLDLLGNAARPVVSSNEIASRLDPDTLLLEFSVLPERVVVFAIRAGIMRMISVTMTTPDVPRLLDAVRDDVAAASKVIIVPDGILQRVSFAPYLLKTHAISVAPSASLLAANGKRAPKQGAILIVGNPEGDDDVPALPEVEEEVNTLVSVYRDTTLLFGANATKARFMAEAAKHDAIHFSGHGFSDDEALTSSLLFARTATDDGRMYMSDIARLRLPRAPLVVLAACGTLRGRASGVEGMPSIARSFLEAGASTVVGTLADVNDEITARLLRAFHRHLAAGDSPADGLRKAQLEAIARGGDDAREENWAPFVVYTTVP